MSSPVKLSVALTRSRGEAADGWLRVIDQIRDDSFNARPARQRVKIAVLDTSIDHEHPFFQDDKRLPRIVAKESFFNIQDPESVKDSPRDTKDTHGHGTHIAGILLQVAPDADLYIGRVVRGDDSIQDDALRISKVRHCLMVISFLIITWLHFVANFPYVIKLLFITWVLLVISVCLVACFLPVCVCILPPR
jgi:hypothetical protein